MFYTGLTHNANTILKEETKSLKSNRDKIEATKKLCDMTRELKYSLEQNNVDALGETLKRSWEIKRSLATRISNPLIDNLYQKALENGAVGGKLLGAGGGGFLLFYVPTEEGRRNVRKALSSYQEMPFELDQSGVSIIFMD